MLDPKTFYRKLDFLLTKIGKEKTGKHFMYGILKNLEDTFGADLHIADGRLYTEAGDRFELSSAPGAAAVSRAVPTISIQSEAVQRALRHGTYIYDDPAIGADWEIVTEKEYSIPVAFTVVRGAEERWIVVFELRGGWSREEVEFCLNAVRVALNYRLFADAVKSDLLQAAQIQRSLLPGIPSPMCGYEIAARAQPADLVGGDFFDYFHHSEEMFGISIGDASGHGLPAALLVRDVVTGLRMGLEEEMKMVQTLKRLNRVIQRSTYSTLFVSLFYGEIESNGNLIYVNAGHPSPLLIHEDKVTELTSTGMILGAVPDITLRRAYAHFAPNAVLVLYSDGILERKSLQKHEFSVDRLTKLIRQHQEKSAQEILNAIFDAVFAFGGDMKWGDDATAIVIKRISKTDPGG
jgi:sigma-B regulation protein RsbU (phosphoserine phosphatase)